MQITRIQIKSKQSARGTYDAIVIMFDDMHFSMDLLGGLGGERSIKRIFGLAAELGVDVECREPRLQGFIAKAMG